MDERADLILREADGPNPPALLHDLVGALDELLPTATDAGGKWLKGKGEAEVSKAMEIRARALKLIGDMQHDRERLIAERDAAQAAASNDREKAAMAHKERMYELRTARLKDAVECVLRLRDMGVEIELRVIEGLVREVARSTKER